MIAPEFMRFIFQELLRNKLKNPNTQFDLVSSQLVLHYSFESFEKANRFLRNAAELLRIGGYFIGTTVNSCRVVYVRELIFYQCSSETLPI